MSHGELVGLIHAFDGFFLPRCAKNLPSVHPLRAQSKDLTHAAVDNVNTRTKSP